MTRRKYHEIEEMATQLGKIADEKGRRSEHRAAALAMQVALKWVQGVELTPLDALKTLGG